MKPESIIELEKILRITLKIFVNEDIEHFDNRNSFQLDKNNDIVELNLKDNQLSDISILHSFLKIEKLYLGSNKLTDVSALNSLVSLTYLNLSNNQLSNISALSSLESLTNLNLKDNQLSDISILQSFKKIKKLYLGYNKLTDVSVLNSLVSLTSLNLSDNQLSDISALSSLVSLTSLNLSDNQLSDISALSSLVSLTYLNLNNNQLSDISALSSLELLTNLNLMSNQLTDIFALDSLINLMFIDLDHNQLTDISSLSSLKELAHLFVSDNQLLDISFLSSLILIESFHASQNKLSNIDVLKSLKKLRTLFLNKNEITDISVLHSLINLEVLFLNSNQITDVSVIKSLEKLESINLDDNPIKNLPISDLNDAVALRGYFKSLEKEKNKLITNKYIKINILGHGNIGKTQLFNWFLGRKFEEKRTVTHGTNADLYVLKKEQHSASLWDFGGQSYQHGTHSLFLRPSDFYIVMFRSRKEKKEDYGYWLGASRSFSSKTNPLFLLQSIWTEKDDKQIYPKSQTIERYNVNPNHIFSLDIKKCHEKNKSWLAKKNDFTNILNKEIVIHAKSFGKIPKEFIEIKEAVEKYQFSKEIYTEKELFKTEFCQNYDSEKFAYLLGYLEFTGTILYFREKEKLQDYVFVNPESLSNWIYETILNEDFYNNDKGVLDFNELKRKVEVGEEKASIFKTLMVNFNLLFEEPIVEKSEENNQGNLVIPQFLPENNTSFKSVLLDLIPFTFSIRFEDFIYEGRIFNFISTYGKYAKDTSSYWKYGILFRKDNIQVVVFYDNDNKSLHVHIENKKGYEKLAKEILEYFISIDLTRSIYNDNKEGIIKEKIEGNVKIYSKERELDVKEIFIGAQLSVNNKNYIDIIETLEQKKEDLKIGICVDTRKSFLLSPLTLNLLNMEDKKLKKVFISYSRKDYKFKDELKNHLSLLERYGLISDWSCDEMKPGKWNSQIQAELAAADIIVYMVSHNFLESDYIMDEEVKKGIKLIEADSSKKIINVLVRDCIWDQWSKIEEIAKKANKSFSDMRLDQYQFLPYHQADGVEKLLPLEEWNVNRGQSVNAAYKQIAKRILNEIS
jgi:internalin A